MLVVVFLLLLMVGLASAQVLELGASAGASRLSNNTLVANDPQFGTIKLSNGFRFGFRITVNTHSYLGHEVGYAYVRTNWDAPAVGGTIGTAAHQGFYDFLLYARPEGSRVRPFIAGGVQFTNFIFPGLSVSQGGGSTKFGLNYGAGVKAKVSDRFLMRLDFRQYGSPKPDFFTTAPKGWLKMNEISAGFAYTM